MMKELYAAYEAARAANRAECERLNRLIERHKAMLEKTENNCPGWFNVCERLAATISGELDMDHKIYGPFGMNCRVSIYFFPTDGRDITRNETYSISLQPDFDANSCLYMSYETGEEIDIYREGTIGWLNGENKVTAPLPDDLPAIIALLRHHEAKEEA